MGILDKFTNIDDLLVSLIERIGGVTEEDTHFFSYPADGTRATVQAGKTTLDFMGGTVMDTDGAVTSLGNSLRARGREYCRSLTLQGDQDIVVQIGTKSKIPIYAGLRFKVSHLRFTEVKIITTVPTELTLIACTNADAVSIDGEIITRTGLGINNFPSDYVKPADIPADYVKPADIPSDYIKPGESVNVGNHPSDYFKADEAAVIKGADGATKREVLVDGTGVMLSRMKGAHGGVLNDIAIDSSGIMLSRMKGADGGVLKDILVDSTGIMLARMKGADGAVLKDIAVDADGIMMSRMKGKYAGALRDIAVDNNGYMKALLKGMYNGYPKDIATDGGGTLLARMCGVHAGLTTNVAVDADGFMISVMKGDYNGALKTWKVDDEGRGEMFVADPPDVWGQVRQMGLAELAVRTHAPALVFDRRGDVIRWNDFESSTKKCETFTYNSTMSRSTEYANTGDFSEKCQLNSHPAICHLDMQTQDFHPGNIGFQAQFSVINLHGYIHLKITRYTGTNQIRYVLQLDFDAGTISYNNGTDVVMLDSFDFHATPENFSTVKIVANLTTRYPVRAIVFGKEYDLSGVPQSPLFADATAAHLETSFQFASGGTGNNTLYADNLVLTENEP